MNREDLKERLLEEEKRFMVGWDFSHLKGRVESEPLPWDYRSIINHYLRPHHRLLDMGTGGGEFLLTLNHPYERTTVTESFEPNIELCKKTLVPLGITVTEINDDSNLPFEDESFDVVINRHESYNPQEVWRILKPNGLFITQQVGGRNNRELSEYLIDDFTPPYPQQELEQAVEELKASGFTIFSANEYFPYLRFYDVGALVYYAKVISWEFPNFSVERCFSKLYELHQKIQEQSYIECREHRYLIVAKKEV